MSTITKNYDIYDLNEYFEAVFLLHNTDYLKKDNYDNYMIGIQYS